MDVVTIILGFLVLALVVEFVTNIIKGIIQVEMIGKVKTAPIIAMFVGVGVALLCRADLLTALGWTTVSAIAAQVVTGLLISGGSSIIYELISKLRESRTSVKTDIFTAATSSVTQGGQPCPEEDEDK